MEGTSGTLRRGDGAASAYQAQRRPVQTGVGQKALARLWEDAVERIPDACECLKWKCSGRGHGVEGVIIPYKSWQTEKQESLQEKKKDYAGDKK